MSELKLCPFCGSKSNYYSPSFNAVICDCGASALPKVWNTRVLSWVPVSEKLPEKNGVYLIKLITNDPGFGEDIDYFTDEFTDGKWKMPGLAGSKACWLDDRTDKEDK